METSSNALRNIQIFVSYSRTDTRWVAHDSEWSLIPWLEEQLQIVGARVWWDRDLKEHPGKDYRKRIQEEIRRSQIAILLISQEFIARPFINKVELPAIRDRVEEGTMLLIPILVGEVVWEFTEFSRWLHRLQLVPSEPPIPIPEYCESKHVNWPALRTRILANVLGCIEEASKLPPPTYSLTVVKGTGGGSYAAGSPVTLDADPAPAGQAFDRWTGGFIADAASAQTTFTMPAADTRVAATYKSTSSPTYSLTVVNGTGGGSCAAGSLVTLNADPAPAGQAFDRWIGGFIADAASAQTTLTMPAADTRVAATYKSTSSPTYSLTVVSGTGGGSYAAGSLVTLNADPAPGGQAFDRWIGGFIADAASAQTTLTMPAADTRVAATYIPLRSPPTSFAERVRDAKRWLQEMPRDPELSAKVRKALEEATVGTKGWRGPIEDKNSGRVWQELYDSCRGAEVPGLCLALVEPHKDWTTPWKTHTFLKYSFRTAEGKAHAQSAFPLVVAFSGAGGTSAQGAALETIEQAPVPPTLKWEGLQYAIDQSDSESLEAIVPMFVQFGKGERQEATRGVLLRLLNTANIRCARVVLEKLPEVTSTERRSVTASALLDHLITATGDIVDAFANTVAKLVPPSNREQAAAVLLDVLERVQTSHAESAIVEILGNWNYRQAVPRLRGMFDIASLSKSRSISYLLAKWRDRESGTLVREAVERFRYGSQNGYLFDGLVGSLYTLEGSACAPFIAKVLLEQTPFDQQVLLRGCLRQIHEAPISAAIRELAASSPDAQVKKLAAQLVK